MSLTTPEQIRRLQRKLYVQAKVEPTRRFHQLYDKVYRADILARAYRLARSQNGAPGVDGVSFADIEARGEGPWLAALRKELHDKTYRPDPVRRVMIPKPGGGERPLGIPTIRDRVVQGAAKLRRINMRSATRPNDHEPSGRLFTGVPLGTLSPDPWDLSP